MKLIEDLKARIDSWLIKVALRIKGRKDKIAQLENETAREKLYKRFKEVAYFIDWTDKQLTSRKERKQFWGQFIESKQIRTEYFEKFLSQFEKEQK